MTRLIERWFPCAEVSDNSRKGWGSGITEKQMFPWFAARPLVQAKAAVICSLLPCPDDPSEQKKLEDLVRLAMEGYDAAHREIVAKLNKYYPDGSSILDPFAGRAIIPHEAARLGIKAWGIEYSPVATLAGTLLADYPLRDWAQEPPLPFDDYQIDDVARTATPRLLYDVKFIADLIGRRYESEMDEFYPKVNEKRPWGYLWAITLPCVNCGRRFPLTASLELRRPKRYKKYTDPGQSYDFHIDRAQNRFTVVVHKGKPRRAPTLIKKAGSKGKVAICPFCDNVHTFDTYTRLMGDGHAKDALLLAADVHARGRKTYRETTQIELKAIKDAGDAIKLESPFANGLPAIPHEKVVGSTGPRDYARFGYHTYGDFWNTRQTLGLIRLSRIIKDLSSVLNKADISPEYAVALVGYATSVLARTIRSTTRGCTLQIKSQSAGHIFGAGPPVPWGYDYVETGCGEGSGTWRSVSNSTIKVLEKQLGRTSGVPANIQQGTATQLTMPNACLDAVVTDPPYDAMVEYSDASDMFYVWLKRALIVSHPEFGLSSNSAGVQDKTDEAVVKMTWNRSGDPRTPEHYTRSMIKALTEARRVIKQDGVVTIMFGHDDPEVWNRFLSTIDNAGLVLTGSWPARTERGKQLNKANIETTLTLVCRPLSKDRTSGKMLEVDNLVKQEILRRIEDWKRDGLALPDQRMASYGPAMEIVGRYSKIYDKSGNSVSLSKYLAKARRYVDEATEIRIGDTPLEAFDSRSHFGLFWIYMYGRTIVPGSELRWLRLGWEMKVEDTEGLLKKQGQGFRLIYADEIKQPRERRSVIDVALAVAGAGKSPRDIAAVLVDAGMVGNELLWDSISHLAQHVTEADRDGDVWTWTMRYRSVITGSSPDVEADRTREEEGGTQTKMKYGRR